MKKQITRSLFLFTAVVALMTLLGLSASAKTVTEGDFVFEVENSSAALVSYSGTATDVEIPSKAGSAKVTSIEPEAFWQNKTMEYVTIPSTVTEIGYAAFNECTALKKVVLPSKVKVLGDGIFWYCTSLKKVVVPESVKIIGDNAFKGCSNAVVYVEKGSYAEEYIKALGTVSLGYRYAESITLNYKTLTVGLTAERTLKATLSPDKLYNTKVSYKSSDESVVKVTSSGKVTATGIGKAVITVTAKDGSGLKAECAVTVNPQKVKTLKHSSMTSTSVKITWSTVTDATGYKLYKYSTSKKKWVCVKTTTGTSYTDKNVSMGDTAKYKVRAYTKLPSKTYYGAYSSVYTVNMSEPGAVSSLKIAAAENYAKLSWKKAENANGYRVYLYSESKKEYVRKASTTSLNAKITGLKPNTEYKFAVQAYYKISSKNVVFSDKKQEITVLTRPATVSGLTADKNSIYFDRITVKWTPAKDITGYEVYVLNKATDESEIREVAYNESSLTLTGLHNSTKYAFKIRAFTQRGEEKVYSYYSSAVYATTLSLPETSEAAFKGFTDALNATKTYQGNAVLYKDTSLKDFSGDKNDTVISNMTQTGSAVYNFTKGKTPQGDTVSSHLGAANKECTLKFEDIAPDSLDFKANGSGYEVSFTLGNENSAAQKNSLITDTVDWDKVEDKVRGFSLLSCYYTGTRVTAKIQGGLISYMEIEMPLTVNFKTGLANTYSFSQTIVTTTAFIAV